MWNSSALSQLQAGARRCSWMDGMRQSHVDRFEEGLCFGSDGIASSPGVPATAVAKHDDRIKFSHRRLELEDEESCARPAAQVKHGLVQGRRKSSTSSCGNNSLQSEAATLGTSRQPNHFARTCRAAPLDVQERCFQQKFPFLCILCSVP